MNGAKVRNTASSARRSEGWSAFADFIFGRPVVCVLRQLGNRMKFWLVGVALLFCNGALAEGGGATSSGSGQAGVRAEAPKADNVPTGGCMPIGLTARGELVFPMQCRELLDRERGPADGATSGAPQTAAPAAEQVAAAPEQARLRAPARKLSAVRRRNKQRTQADTATTANTAKKP
jgi:hypothetical protein